jgi:small subunit ribosomal protein S13
MARLAGIELQDNWKVDYALTRISGVGWTSSKKILAKLKISNTKRVNGLTPDELSKINTELDGYTIEGELARKVRADIARLQTIGSFRGHRHSKNLPVRGQRTRRNARTKRGKRKTIGAFKKEILSKMKGPGTETTEAKK